MPASAGSAFTVVDRRAPAGPAPAIVIVSPTLMPAALPAMISAPVAALIVPVVTMGAPKNGVIVTAALLTAVVAFTARVTCGPSAVIAADNVAPPGPAPSTSTV